MLVKQRNRLRKKGRLEEANKLAEKINVCIQDVRTKQYSRMCQASPKELWAAVKATNGAHRSTEKPSYLLRDVERVNNYFASVCYDPSSSATHGICCSRSLCNPHNSNIVLQPYEVERLVSRIKASSPGIDNIPHWFFVHVHLKLLRLLQISFAFGTVSKQWLSAVVAPVPKVAKPETLSDYRLISVTALLSRTAEKLVVSRWLLPAIPSCTLDDQFGFRPTGSTTCALTCLLHHVTRMFERFSYVRCIMIDFSFRPG